jgi:hypothetical protein
MFLPDSETRVDLLNNEAIAMTIVELLREQSEHPVTIGVHGDWGAGKSSILEMVESQLQTHDGILCLKVNGWRFQGFEDAKIALIEAIVTGLIEKRPTLTKAGDAVKDVFKRIDWLKVAKHAGSLALTATTGIPSPAHIQLAATTFQTLFSQAEKKVTSENLKEAVEGLQSILKPASESKNVPQEIAEFRKAFDNLLDKAGVRHLIVLVDDLDRCLPEVAIETLEAIRLFVFTKRTAFVIAADEAMIEYSVRKHFPELPDTTGPRDYARNYLEKLIQVPFRIAALGEAETRTYVMLLLVGAEMAPDDESYVKLVATARELLRRPWTNSGLEAKTVLEVLGEKADRVQTALTVSEQVARMLTAGTRGNPRQIKRFLNSLLLRKAMADARGFGEEIRLPILAKLMLAERFIPRLFDQIALSVASNPKGYCDELEAAETTKGSDGEPVKSSGMKSTPAKRRTPQAEKNAFEEVIPDKLALTEWSTDRVRAWMQLMPSLVHVDLRPYLFIAKDQRNLISAVTGLGPLASLVDSLLGSKLSVQSLAPRLSQVNESEAAQLFEAVVERIINEDSFEKEPPGVAGLTVLAKSHPLLQSRLMDFLEMLPADRCGSWIVGGWGGVFSDAGAKSRFESILQKWATNEKNVALRAAALSTQRVGKK